METINWEKMKQRAKDEFSNKVGIYNYGNSTTCLALIAAMSTTEKPRDILENWVDYGIQLINNWDIRKCMKLAELFPSCLPKTINPKSIPTLDYDENGDWQLIFS